MSLTLIRQPTPREAFDVAMAECDHSPPDEVRTAIRLDWERLAPEVADSLRWVARTGPASPAVSLALRHSADAIDGNPSPDMRALLAFLFAVQALGDAELGCLAEHLAPWIYQHNRRLAEAVIAAKGLACKERARRAREAAAEAMLAAGTAAESDSTADASPRLLGGFLARLRRVFGHLA